MGKDKLSKVNARSLQDAKAKNKRLLASANKAVPPEKRMDFHPETTRRLNQNITAALVLQDLDGQRIACCEEMAELMQLLCRDANGKEASHDKIQEEIADVYITVAQMARIYFKDKDQFNAAVMRKMTKLESRLKSIREMLE